MTSVKGPPFYEPTFPVLDPKGHPIYQISSALQAESSYMGGHTRGGEVPPQYDRPQRAQEKIRRWGHIKGYRAPDIKKDGKPCHCPTASMPPPQSPPALHNAAAPRGVARPILPPIWWPVSWLPLLGAMDTPAYHDLKHPIRLAGHLILSSHPLHLLVQGVQSNHSSSENH